MIGRFIELGLETDDILESIGFYEDLGFRQLSVGDAWSHPYAVLGDGSLCIGLHAVAQPGPLLTFVLPGLAGEINELRSRGVEFHLIRTADDQFNELIFTGPDMHYLRVVEARTFSPPDFEEQDLSLCGRFREITLPTRDLETALVSWERLGFERVEQADEPYPHARVHGGGIALGLHQTRDIDRLALSFDAAPMSRRLARLDAKGFFPTDGAAPPGVSMLRSPEGLPMLLYGD